MTYINTQGKLRLDLEDLMTFWLSSKYASIDKYLRVRDYRNKVIKNAPDDYIG